MMYEHFTITVPWHGLDKKLREMEATGWEVCGLTSDPLTPPMWVVVFKRKLG